ncbi:MAG: aspartyl protease family protein [Verrucomicrobia bacterium]|nr:aspartyl protease family protein [Verrucomicrobiota bacterium]
MTPSRRSSRDRRLRHLPVWLLAGVAVLLCAGCFSFRRSPPRPGRTTLDSRLVILPATPMASYLVVETKWDKHGPYHFLIDTGASITLISPELAARYGAKNAPDEQPVIRVRSSQGDMSMLSPVTLRRIELGGAEFENVSALVYDCTELSAHFGVKIDGILGFPLFRETILTLDYPRSRVLIEPRSSNPLLPGVTIPFNNDRRTPIIPVRIGDQNFVALIDSGSDAALSLNPIGLQPAFAIQPRAGVTIATLSGDREQRIGRVAKPLYIGDYAVDSPVTDLTEDLSSIGSGILKNFAVTFDQEHNRVTFYRDSPLPIPTEPRRSSGLSFSKTPAYWRITSVVPGSPAEAAGVQRGDLVTRINGEPVAQWDLRRYEQLVATAPDIAFTFLNGTRETEQHLKVFVLVP